jgi:glycolate dehydrogenase iron-sulfur subunit
MRAASSPEGTPGLSLPGSELCVHCGFCLQACPTYLAFDDENDSPRGRIVLMKAIAEGSLSATDTDAQLHLDRCLGCRACETACPSGVPYGQLLEATRERIAPLRPPPTVARLILFVFAHPVLVSFAMWGARLLRRSGVPTLLSRLPGSMGFAMAMLSSTRRRRSEINRRYVATGDGSRETVAALGGCVMEGLFTAANRATERTLIVNGYRLVAAPGQRCCGALHAHAGDAGTARALARANIAAFELSGAALIAVNSAGCGAMMKSYGHLLRDDPGWHDRATQCAAKVRDVSELLSASGPIRGGPLPGRVAYDAACHLLHGQRVVTAPLAVLEAIPELLLVPLEGSEQCCGSAGIYNLVEPDASNRVLEPKLAHVAAAGAAVIATGNPGCLMQIGAGLARSPRSRDVPVLRHPVELLDASYANRGPGSLQ